MCGPGRMKPATNSHLAFVGGIIKVSRSSNTPKT